MLKPDKSETFFQEFSRLLPRDLQRARTDLEKNVKAALHATFDRMDLVTREEFDVQRELLSRTRQLLEDMEKRVEELESELAGYRKGDKTDPGV